MQNNTCLELYKKKYVCATHKDGTQLTLTYIEQE